MLFRSRYCCGSFVIDLVVVGIVVDLITFHNCENVAVGIVADLVVVGIVADLLNFHNCENVAVGIDVQ